MSTSSASSAEKQASCIISDPADVILVVGTSQRHLHVQSACLKSASSVFKAMFRSHWKEGQDLQAHKNSELTSLPEIALPEDNEDAMEKLCYLIHHHPIGSVKSPDDVMLRVAVLMDKYSISVTLRPFMRQWLQPHPALRMVEAAQRLAAAYVLKEDQAFRNLSRFMVLEYSKSFAPCFGDSLILDSTPRGLFCKRKVAIFVEDYQADPRSVLLEEHRTSTLDGLRIEKARLCKLCNHLEQCNICRGDHKFIQRQLKGSPSFRALKVFSAGQMMQKLEETIRVVNDLQACPEGDDFRKNTADAEDIDQMRYSAALGLDHVMNLTQDIS